MYARGEYVVHPGQGVCQVSDVEAGAEGMYKLLPLGRRNPITISFPKGNEERLRPILERDEALAIIEGYDEIELDDYTDRSGVLEEEHFKAQMREGTCEDAVRIVKTFRSRIAAAIANNKKPPVAYERILKEASERSLMELAVALDSTKEDIASMFAEFEGSEN